MRKIILGCITVLSLIMVGAGCSGPAADGKDVPESVTNELQALGEAAKKAGGDYSKLSPADQQKFISRTGSEEGAKAMVQRMATPPPNMGGK